MAEKHYNKSGIYVIKNINTNKVYVGSSFSIGKRICAHNSLLQRGKHHSIKLQNAWNKYGKESFTFELLEQVFFSDELSKEYKFEILECIEQYYINLYDSCKSGYNVSANAGIPITHKSLESIEKQKKTVKEKGWFRSEESKQKSKDSAKNSERVKNANKINGLASRKKIYQYALNGKFIKEWSYMKEASVVLDISLGGICDSANRVNVRVNNFMFKYFKKESIDPYIKKTGKGIKKDRRYVVKKDRNGNIIFIYDGIWQVVEEYNFSKSKVIGIINSGIKNKTADYILEYGEYHK